MRNWIIISIAIVVIAVGTLSGAQQSSKQMAEKGLSIFHEVLGGDEAKLPEVLQFMEDAQKADEKNIENLYNLARVYFYEFLTHNRPEALSKSERTLARIMELNPNHTESISFHGGILALQSGGRDLPKFMQGAKELNAAVERAPKNINNRIVRAFVSSNFPPEGLAAMGNYDPLKDLELVSIAFDGNAFYYAPHADVVMKALVGDAYMKRGLNDQARAKFEAALAIPKPADAGERAGREILDNAIRARMNGEAKAFTGKVFSGCHSCHLNAPDKLPK